MYEVYRDIIGVFFIIPIPSRPCWRQNRIQRCIMDCTDEARDLIPPGAKEGDAVVQRAMDQVTDAHQFYCR